MGRNPAQNQEQRERTRQRLLRTALVLFAERGVEQVSVAEVAEAAGVSKGLIYHYFETRDALLWAVLEAHIDTVTQLATGGSGAVSLGELALRMSQAVHRDPSGYRLLLRVLSDPAGNERVRGLVQSRLGAFQARADALAAHFSALGAADAAVEARFFQATLVGILVLQATSPLAGSPEPLVHRLLLAVGLPLPVPGVNGGGQGQ